MEGTDLKIAYFEFIIDSLGFNNVPVEQRAVVLCKVLKELGIPFKKHYYYEKYRAHRGEPALNIVIAGDCTEEYGNYVLYLFKQRMETIEKLNSMLPEDMHSA